MGRDRTGWTLNPTPLRPVPTAVLAGMAGAPAEAITVAIRQVIVAAPRPAGQRSEAVRGEFRAPLGVRRAGWALLPSRSRAYEMGCDS
jgi:hypothetical protein